MFTKCSIYLSMVNSGWEEERTLLLHCKMSRENGISFQLHMLGQILTLMESRTDLLQLKI